MKKILVLAYAISPTKGSEFSVGWNYVINMAKYYDIHVLYGCSGNSIGEVSEIEEYMQCSSLKNIHFYPVKANFGVHLLNLLNKIKIFPYSFYFALKYWHWLAYRYANRIIQNENISFVHYVSPIGYREPGQLWRLNKPYIWGPIGGTYNIDWNLFCFFSFKEKIRFGLRNIINMLQLNYSISLKQAISHTDVILGCTTNTCNTLTDKFAKPVLYLPENSIQDKRSTLLNSKFYFEDGVVHFVWVGRIDAAKALTILINSLFYVKNKDRVKIHVVGTGPLERKMKLEAQKNGVDNLIIWYGFVPRTQVLEIMDKSHVHIMTSLKEANSTVLLEAMSLGLPTISLDICGMHDLIKENTGIKISTNHSKKTFYINYSNAIDYFVENSDVLRVLSENVLASCDKYSWKKRVDFFHALYESILNEK